MQNKQIKNIPKIFWKYYDLYRRKKITIFEFSEQSKLKTTELYRYLKLI